MVGILKMPLDVKEKEILKAQGELTLQTVGLQNQVVELVRQEQPKQASELLYSKTIPMQDRVFVYLSDLDDYQSEATHAANRVSKPC